MSDIRTNAFLYGPAGTLTEPGAAALRRQKINPGCFACGFACYTGERIDELNEEADAYEQRCADLALEDRPGVAEAGLAAKQRDVMAAEMGGRLADFARACPGVDTAVAQDGTLRQQMRACRSKELKRHDDAHLLQALGQILYGK